MMRVVYTREFLLQCASSPYCQLSPRGISNIANNMPEIVRIVSGFRSDMLLCYIHIDRACDGGIYVRFNL